MHPVTALDARPACADRLDLVDAAYAHPGDSGALRALCADCPVAADCLAFAMVHGEYGVWGGTSPKVRTNRGAPPAFRARR